MARSTDSWLTWMAAPMIGKMIIGIRTTPTSILGSLTSSLTSLTMRAHRLLNPGYLHEDLFQVLGPVPLFEPLGGSLRHDDPAVYQGHPAAQVLHLKHVVA